MAVAAPDEQHLRNHRGGRLFAAAFDAEFYRAAYSDIPSHVALRWHYRVRGWIERRDPAPWFSSEQYLEDNPDVAAADIDPFLHYLTRGRFEGREITPSKHAAAVMGAFGWNPPVWDPDDFQPAVTIAPTRPGLSDEARAAVTAAFDRDFYLAAYPDVALSGMDPLAHFLETGWMEGRDPTARFSTAAYLDAHPDVAAAEVNAFAHYLTAGRAEGRALRHDRGFRYDIIARLPPPGQRLSEALARAARVRTDPPERLAVALAALGDAHLTFSHDNFIENGGGLQMCLRRESVAFQQCGVDHLHLFPASPWTVTREPDETGPLGVLLNGRRLGAFAAETVLDALRAAPAGGAARSVAVHSLLGHEPAVTAAIARAFGGDGAFFWLHDFASLCAGFHLVRNDVEDCGAPAPDSAACGVCVNQPLRARHLNAHRRLFEDLRMTVVAPSETTLAFWRSRTDLPAVAEVVVPHARLETELAPAAAAEGPFRVAFLGMPVSLKGWGVFRELSERFADDPRYAFLHLGGQASPDADVSFHEVRASTDQPDAMRATLETLAPDAALIWPLCRETFSFTAYEAAAAGAAVITNRDSGNVAAFAAAPGIGRVLADEAALVQAFETGEILALARGRREVRTGRLVYSAMTRELTP